MEDVIKISNGTSKEDELFNYIDAPSYLRTREKDYSKDNSKSNNFDMYR